MRNTTSSLPFTRCLPRLFRSRTIRLGAFLIVCGIVLQIFLSPFWSLDFSHYCWDEYLLPDIDSEGFWTRSLTMTSTAGSYPIDETEIIFPWNGTAMHFATTLHPIKDFKERRYTLTSLWFFEGPDPFSDWGLHHGACPDDTGSMVFECHYDNETVVGHTNLPPARKEYLLTECPPPSLIQPHIDGPNVTAYTRYKAMQGMRAMNVSIYGWLPLDPEVHGAERMATIPDNITTRVVEGKTQVLLARQEISQWETPTEEAEIGICVSPMRFDGLNKMTDLLEWRIFHKYQGVDVVHWYSRTPLFEDWITRMNQRLNTKDTYKYAPLRANVPSYKLYVDQPPWYYDCLLRHGFANKWMALIDVDEYLFPTDVPDRNGLRDRLSIQDESVGSIAVYQDYYGGERVAGAPSVEGFDMFPRNAWSEWEPNYLLGGHRYAKLIHRTAGSYTWWVHGPIELGRDYEHVLEDAQGQPGTLQLLHSRRQKYPGLEFTKNNTFTSGWRRQWSELAEMLGGLEDLHTLSSDTTTFMESVGDL